MKRPLLLPLLVLALPALAQYPVTNDPPATAEPRPVATVEAGWTPVLLQLGWPGDPVEADSLRDVYGLALGLFTVSADNVVGADLALGFPATRESVWGVQAGLFGAIVEHRMNGIQIGGLFTGSERLSGIGLGGLFAGSDHVSGVCAGGLMAVTERLDGIALGGLFAGAETGHGIVASFGFTDTGNAAALANAPSRPFTGIQLAFLANFGSDVTGVQIAPFFNFAGELHGLQVGLFNRAFTGCGVQIGLFNAFGRYDDTLALPFLNARF